jgi:hypothetical protein
MNAIARRPARAAAGSWRDRRVRRLSRSAISHPVRNAVLIRGAIIRVMSDGQEEQWSPARHPYAIAVSQSWWAFQAALLFAADAKQASGTAQQIYARQIFGQLRALRRCAEMQARELRRLAIDQANRDVLDREIEGFDAAVPAAKHGRDILEHFDEYARGEGKLQQEAVRERGVDVFEAAATYWGGGYDPSTEALTQGPFVMVIPDALAAAERLYHAIYAAGRAVDSLGSRRGS